MKTVEMVRATHPLADYTKEAKKEPLIVTVKGKPVAALVSIRNADAETVALSSNKAFIALVERSRGTQTSKGGLTPAEMRSRLQKARRRAAR